MEDTTKSTPLVSVICLVYNHEQYLRDALEGFVNQKTTFPFEVVVHDDASTDGSAAIIREYEAKYPDIIKPIYQTVNQHSLERGRVTRLAHEAARGKYIASCEGDDFWVTTDKLQKQADFLEAHPDYSMCCGGYRKNYTTTGNEKTVLRSDKNFTFELKDLLQQWIMVTLTTMYRKEAFDLSLLKKYSFFRDIHMFYHILRTGKGYYFAEILGVYNVHPGGSNSMQQGRVNSTAAFNCYTELYKHNGDNFTRIKALKATLNLFSFSLYNKYDSNTLSTKTRLFKQAAGLVRKPIEVKWLLGSIVPKKKKINF